MVKTFCGSHNLFCVFHTVLGKKKIIFQLQSLLVKEVPEAMSPIVVTFYLWITTSSSSALLPLICFYP